MDIRFRNNMEKLLMRTEASKFAGDEMLGSFSIEMTESIIEDTLCVGSHRSSGLSPLIASSPGG